jgi:hypothetical protein
LKRGAARSKYERASLLKYVRAYYRGCPKFLRQSFHEYANESIRHSLWARAFYESQRQVGKARGAAIRALAFKWERIMWCCWKDSTQYNEVYYLTMLQKRSTKLLKLIAEPAEKAA